MDLFTRVHTHPCSIAHTDLAHRPPPSMRTWTLPVSGGPEHTVGASLPSPPLPRPRAPRPGAVSVPPPGTHMWFQLAAERAFPSQTAGPCQGPGPTGARKKGHGGPHPSTGLPGAPGPRPCTTPLSPSALSPSPGARLAPTGERGAAVPGPPARLPALPARGSVWSGGAAARRAGCRGGRGREGACGDGTLITEPLCFRAYGIFHPY